MAKWGAGGVLMYLYLICLILSGGYYMRHDKDINVDIAYDLRLDVKKVESIWEFFFDRGYFDKALYEKYRIISSPFIQEQYQNCTALMKRKVKVSRPLWLLDEEDSKSHVSFIENQEDIQRPL